jgi:hypothetical protein
VSGTPADDVINPILSDGNVSQSIKDAINGTFINATSAGAFTSRNNAITIGTNVTSGNVYGNSANGTDDPASNSFQKNTLIIDSNIAISDSGSLTGAGNAFGAYHRLQQHTLQLRHPQGRQLGHGG